MGQVIPYERRFSIFCTPQGCGFNFGKATGAPEWFSKEEPVSVLSDGGMIGDRAGVKSYTRRQKPR